MWARVQVHATHQILQGNRFAVPSKSYKPVNVLVKSYPPLCSTWPDKQKSFPTKRGTERQCTAAPGVRHSGYGTKVSLCMYHQVASGSVPGSLITHTAVLVQAERQPSCQGDGLWALISSSRYQLWYLVWMTKCWLGWFWSPFSPPRYPRRHYTPVSSVHFPSQSPFCWLFAGNSFQKHLRLWVLKQ